MNIIITGCSKGIGLYLCDQLLKENHTIFGFSRTKPSIENNKFKHFMVDITNESNVKSALSIIRKDYGYVDILINNAGIASMNHFLLTPVKTVRNIMETNYLGTFIMCREVGKLLRKSKNARIINFSTIAVPLNLEGEAAYVSSKAAIESLTKILSKELSDYNITVNAIGPVPIKTDLISGVPKDKLDKLLNSQTIKRFGEKKDILNVVKFFIKPESNFITGQIIYLGGIN